MRVMRTIVWKPGFQNHHDNKSKRFVFIICSRARAAKFLLHFFAVSAFLIPNFMGTYTTKLSKQVFLERRAGHPIKV